MADTLRQTIVMIGMMGAGKTAVGTAVARILGVPFIDTDAEIEQAAHASIAEIFARDGEAFFREKESRVLGRLLGGPPAVLSTGGGVFLSPRNRQMISGRAISVWLKADLDLLWHRVRQREHRPLLKTADPKATLAALYETRGPIYALADVTVDSSPDLSVEGMARKVITRLAVEGHVGEST